MKLISMKCSGCGSTLDVNPSLKQVQCNYCGMMSLIDDEVIRVEHKIVGDYSDRIEAADVYLYKLKDYRTAYNMYFELSKLIPSNPHIWKSLAICFTDDFTRNNLSYREYEFLNDYISNYHKIETDIKTRTAFEIKYFIYGVHSITNNFTNFNEEVGVLANEFYEMYMTSKNDDCKDVRFEGEFEGYIEHYNSLYKKTPEVPIKKEINPFAIIVAIFWGIFFFGLLICFLIVLFYE